MSTGKRHAHLPRPIPLHRGSPWGAANTLCAVLLLAALCSCRKEQPEPEEVPPSPPELPALGDLESFRSDQSPAREICRQLSLPILPDISGIDADGQEQFYGMFNRLRNRPHDPGQYGLLGQLYEAQEFPELAVRLYRRAIELAPNDYRWHYTLALRLAKDGATEQARTEFERAGELQPDYAPVWMQLAWRSVERNDWEQALGFVDRYIQLRPEDPIGYVERAALHRDREDWSRMKEDLEHARRLGPIGKRGHRLFGILYHHLDRPEDSRFHLLMSAERLPGGEMDDPIGTTVRRLQTFRNPLLTKFEGLVNDKRHREALELVDKLIAKYPRGHDNYGVICGRLAECYRQLNDYSNAARYAIEACWTLPDEPDPFVELALVCVHTGKFRAALKAANKALTLKPDHHPALYARALTLIQIAVLDRSRPSGTDAPDPHTRLAPVIKDLQKCIKKQPLNLAYLVALATAHGMLDNFDRANELLDTALRISPEDANALALKRKAEARRSFWPPPQTTTEPAQSDGGDAGSETATMRF